MMYLQTYECLNMHFNDMEEKSMVIVMCFEYFFNSSCGRFDAKF